MGATTPCRRATASPEAVDCGDGAADQADADQEDRLAGYEIARVPTGPPPVIRDADGDGSPDDADCDDANPARSPRTRREILGDAVDEDCRGGQAPFPVVRAT